MGSCDSTKSQKSQNYFVNPNSQKFFADLFHLQTLISNNYSLSENIKLKILINQINNNCQYNVKLYNTIGIKNYKLNDQSQCSILSNLTAELVSPILIRYYFEREQPLLIGIFKTENSYTKQYQIKKTLGCIMGSRKNIFQKKISSKENEIITIQGEKAEDSEDVASIKFEAKSNMINIFSDIKNKIYYEIYSDNILYRSECLDERGKFLPVKIPLNLFRNKMIRILFIQNTKKLIGEFNFNIYEIENHKIFM